MDISYGICCKLKELGYPQINKGNSYFAISEEVMSERASKTYDGIDYDKYRISIPTIEELLDILPDGVESIHENGLEDEYYFRLNIEKHNGYHLSYATGPVDDPYEPSFFELCDLYNQSFIDVLAMGVIWCIENGYIKFDN